MPESRGTPLDAAVAAQARHDFDQALQLTNAALRQHPGDDQARLLQASLHLIRGEVQQAATSCRSLRRSPPLVVVTCHARVAHAAGTSANVQDRLERLIESSAAAQVEADILGWSLGVAGDVAAANAQPYRAVRYFRRSLDARDNPQVRAALVDMLIELGRLHDARDALAGGESSLTLQVQSLIVSRRLGDDVAADAARLDRRFHHWIGHDDYEHAREMARFYLDVAGNAELAWRLAKINAELQHEVEDRRLLSRAAPSGTK